MIYNENNRNEKMKLFINKKRVTSKHIYADIEIIKNKTKKNDISYNITLDYVLLPKKIKLDTNNIVNIVLKIGKNKYIRGSFIVRECYFSVKKISIDLKDVYSFLKSIHIGEYTPPKKFIIKQNLINDE